MNNCLYIYSEGEVGCLVELFYSPHILFRCLPTKLVEVNYNQGGYLCIYLFGYRCLFLDSLREGV